MNDKLRDKLVDAFNNVYHTSETRKVDMRLAAYMVGLRYAAEASKFRGWV